MTKTVARTLTVLLLISLAPILSACNTTAGAGQDISATGQTITKDAKKLTP